MKLSVIIGLLFISGIAARVVIAGWWRLKECLLLLPSKGESIRNIRPARHYVAVCNIISMA